jgi:nicotinate-nucleotide adenylyltransferase
MAISDSSPIAALGVLGGTFDPVHLGHLSIARDVRTQLGLQKVLFIPCGEPPHRAAPVASAEERAEMLELALVDEAFLFMDRRELDRDGPSYMYDTLISLREDYPGSALILLLGTDAFAHLPSWYRWTELTDVAHLAIMARPGFSTQWNDELGVFVHDHAADEASDLLRVTHGLVTEIPVSQVDISSSDLRRCLAIGDNCNQQLPEGVAQRLCGQRTYNVVVDK